MKRDLVAVWELKISLHAAISDRSLAELRDWARGVVDREISASVVSSSLIWNTQGALFVMRTEGSAFPLLETAEWALTNCVPTPQGFELQLKRTAPLVKLGRWQGHVRD